MNPRLIFFLGIGFGLTACVKQAVPPPVAVPPAPPPVVKPAFEKTFGEVEVSGGDALVVHYKDITVLIDPNQNAGTLATLSPRLDYLFLTDTLPAHFNAIAKTSLRKNIKVI